MPEGHTLHGLARDHRRDLRAGPVAASSPQGRFADGAARLDGRTLLRADAHGKHLFHTFDSGDVLHVHLGLIGKWRPTPASQPPVGAVRLRLSSNGHAWDLSGPQSCELLTPEEADRITALLGPDPLRRNADPERFVHAVSNTKNPVGAVLLDQRVVAGIGNVYRAELLFLHGIHPATPGAGIDADILSALWRTMVEQLRAGLRRGRIVTTLAADRHTRDDRLYAYRREGLPCLRCGTPIVGMPLGGRRTWFCPACQR
ncbi:MAG: Fpg/Nei family DNA glycosylase [Acidimicrobiales bacterium]